MDGPLEFQILYVLASRPKIEFLGFICMVHLCVDIVKVDPQAFQKNQKHHFFRDIEKSFQEVTPIGPEPHQFFSF